MQDIMERKLEGIIELGRIRIQHDITENIGYGKRQQRINLWNSKFKYVPSFMTYQRAECLLGQLLIDTTICGYAN